MKKTLTALAIAGSLTFLGAGAAQAGDAAYPQPPVSGTVTDGNVGIGATILFQGAGFAPFGGIGALVSNEATSSSGAGATVGAGGFSAAVGGPIILAEVQNLTTQADGDGNFELPVTFHEAGIYTLTASGEDPNGNPRTVTSTVVVGEEGDDNGTGGVGGGAGGVDGGADDTTAENEAAVATGDRLAETGFDSSALLWGGAGVLALGAGATAVVVSRRKNA